MQTLFYTLKSIYPTKNKTLNFRQKKPAHIWSDFWLILRLFSTVSIYFHVEIEKKLPKTFC